MKKVIVFISMIAVSTASQAMQCPPADAFTYAGSEAHWVLSDAYKSQWHISYSSPNNESDKETLKPTAALDVTLASNNNRYYSMCLYTHGDVRIDVTGGDFSANPPSNPNFHPSHGGVDYICRTSAGSSEVCQW